MELISEYLRNAAECMELSQQRTSERMREQFLLLAGWWLSLAETRDQSLGSAPPAKG